MESLAFQKFYFEAIFAISSFVHIIGLYLCNVCSTPIKFNGLFMCFEHGAYKSFQRVELCKSGISIFSAVNIGAFLSILQYFAINYMKRGAKSIYKKKEKEASKNGMKSILMEHSS